MLKYNISLCRLTACPIDKLEGQEIVTLSSGDRKRHAILDEGTLGAGAHCIGCPSLGCGSASREDL
jgi:hypothetical protein